MTTLTNLAPGRRPPRPYRLRRLAAAGAAIPLVVLATACSTDRPRRPTSA